MNSTYRISARFEGTEQIVAGFTRIKRAADDTESRLARTFRTSHNWGARFSASLKSMQSGYEGLRGVGGIWRQQADSLHTYVDEALRLVRAQEKFKTIGLSAADNERAFSAARKTVAELRGLRLADTTETITDLHGALGDLGHAIEALPQASKYRFAFDTLFGEKFSPDQLNEQIQNAFKYLETTGAVAQGQEEMQRRFNAIAQITAASGGRVTPADLLQMARRGGPAAQGLSLEGLRNISTLIQELGGEGTGTALMSMHQALVGGVMKQSAAAEFMRLGLLDAKKVQFGGAQKIKKLLPGANKLGQLMQEDPLKAADALMEAMRKPLRGKAIDTTDANKVREELAILFGNRTAQKLMSLLTTQRGQVVKEARLAAGAKGVEELYKQALESPTGKLKQFEAEMANFKAEVGLPLVKALSEIAGGIKPILNLAGQYPKLTLFGLALLKLGAASMETATLMKSSGLTSLVAKLLGRGAAASAGSAATSAAGALTKAQAEAMLFGSGGSATGVGAGLGANLGAALGGSLVLAIIGLGLGSLIKNIFDAEEARAEAAAAGEELGKLFADRWQAQLKGQGMGKEFDKINAPTIAKLLLDEQHVGKMETDLGDWLMGSKGSPLGQMQADLLNFHYALGEPSENEKARERIKSTLYNSGIASADDDASRTDQLVT